MLIDRTALLDTIGFAVFAMLHAYIRFAFFTVFHADIITLFAVLDFQFIFEIAAFAVLGTFIITLFEVLHADIMTLFAVLGFQSVFEYADVFVEV
jgi:hypothetical protein